MPTLRTIPAVLGLRRRLAMSAVCLTACLTGDDVKRQVMEALAYEGRLAHAAKVALAPCVVLTPEEAAEIQAACDFALPLLSPDEAEPHADA